MKKEKLSRAPIGLNLVVCFLIPVCTVLFAGNAPWLTSNFSVIAVSGKEQYQDFWRWGLLVGGYFAVVLFQIGSTFADRGVRQAIYLITLTSCACLGCAMLFPYLPQFLPRVAFLHVLWAGTACILIMLALFLPLACGWKENRGQYAPLLLAWAGIAVGSGLLLAVAGMVSSLLEIFFTVSATLLSRSLWMSRKRRQVQRSF